MGGGESADGWRQEKGLLRQSAALHCARSCGTITHADGCHCMAAYQHRAHRSLARAGHGNVYIQGICIPAHMAVCVPPLPPLSPDTHTLRVPKVFHYGLLGGDDAPPGGGGRGGGSFIVMEHLDLTGRLDQVRAGAWLSTDTQRCRDCVTLALQDLA